MVSVAIQKKATEQYHGFPVVLSVYHDYAVQRGSRFWLCKKWNP